MLIQQGRHKVYWRYAVEPPEGSRPIDRSIDRLALAAILPVPFRAWKIAGEER